MVESFKGRPYFNISLLSEMLRKWGLPTKLLRDSMGGSFEKDYGLNKLQTFMQFSKRIVNLKLSLKKKIEKFKQENNLIFGYGAPAKGNVLLNYCDIDNKLLDFIIDTTILKQGKFTPGTKIPIISPNKKPKIHSKMIALMLAWNYKSSIIKNEKNFLKNGGRFLIPIPKAELI